MLLIALDFKKEQIDVFKFPSDFQDALFTLNSSTLENELETFGSECKNKSVLPIDSVSETDVPSSLGSFKNHGVFDEEIYQSIISPSICSAEIKRCTSPITGIVLLLYNKRCHVFLKLFKISFTFFFKK